MLHISAAVLIMQRRCERINAELLNFSTYAIHSIAYALAIKMTELVSGFRLFDFVEFAEPLSRQFNSIFAFQNS